MNYNRIITIIVGLVVPMLATAKLRDPTEPPGIEVPKETVENRLLSLDAVIIGLTDQRYAIINGVLVQQGHWYADAKLERVNADSVILQGPKGTITLNLWRHVIMHEPGSAIPAGVYLDVKSPVAGSAE